MILNKITKWVNKVRGTIFYTFFTIFIIVSLITIIDIWKGVELTTNEVAISCSLLAICNLEMILTKK